MIKVNLLLNKGSAANDVADFEVANEFSSSGNNEQKEAAIKMLLMVLFVVLLYVYESYNLDLLGEEVRRVQKQVQIKQGEIDKYGNVSAESEKQKQKMDELELKKEVIGELARSRITALKALDFIQNIIPSKVWLNVLKLKEGVMTFEGYAISEEELNEFLAQLERRSSYFKDVIMEKSEDKTTKQGQVKSFIISTKLVVEK